ncbi:hypothetical protein, partial [Mitsuokella multacida]|uniref:hypothetical protein n=1 Tax=Mitsuokella multacida TaxID=52226 RepID=UPI003FEFA49B
EAHEVSGAIPAGSRAAPAGGTYPPDLSSVRFFFRVRSHFIFQVEWGGLFLIASAGFEESREDGKGPGGHVSASSLC